MDRVPPRSIRNIIKKHAVVIGAFLLWIPAVGVGAHSLLDYANTPGRLATPPAEWPSGAISHLESNLPTLVVFVHPHCGCSQATLDELAQIMARCRGRARAYVYVYAPKSEPPNWVKTGLWRDAEAIPGVRVMEDPDGRETRRFGASTSGQTLLYNATGQLVFNGGLTASRGHLGANDGEDAVVSLLLTGKASYKTTRVFGCSLLGSE
jgi:hypothetical protein